MIVWPSAIGHRPLSTSVGDRGVGRRCLGLWAGGGRDTGLRLAAGPKSPGAEGRARPVLREIK